MKFYNVKKKDYVTIKDADCEKVVYEKETSKGVQKRYAARAIDKDKAMIATIIPATISFTNWLPL